MIVLDGKKTSQENKEEIKHKVTGKSYPKIYGKNSLTISSIKKLKEIPPKVYEKS